MLQIQTKGTGDFVEVPKGTYAARLVDVVDEGYREDKFSQPPGGQRMQYRLTYLLSELMPDGRPFVISEWINISRLAPDGSETRGARFKSDGKMSNFVARVEALTGMDIEAVGVTRFDDELELAEWLIGKGCMIQTGHKPNGKSKVVSVVAMPRGMKAPDGPFMRKRDRGLEQPGAPVYAPGRNATTLPGEPPWMTEVLTVGKFKGKTWTDMAQGSMGGGRHEWLRFVVLSGEPRDEGQRVVQDRACVVLAMYESRNVAAPPVDEDLPF